LGAAAVLNDAKTGVQVRDVMSSPVRTVLEHDSVEQAAQKMIANDLGSIIVTDAQGNPVGIITERDVVDRVVAVNRVPRKVTAEAVMSRPVHMTTPDADIKDAAESMRNHHIRRLVVMEAGKMIGIVSSKDIVEITSKSFLKKRGSPISRYCLLAESSPPPDTAIIAGSGPTLSWK
jgi:CBS domain-containing protein